MSFKKISYFKNKMKSLFIVFEGLDGSGKTTIIKELLKRENKQFVYSKGVRSKLITGKILRKFSFTWLFMLDLIYLTYKFISPNLRKGKIILQDRYLPSIISYIPISKRRYNRFIILFLSKFLKKPDAIVYFHLPLEERIKRLKQKGKKYELILAGNPEIITLREKEYKRWYDQFNGPKVRIDTQKNNIKQTTRTLEEFVESIKSQNSTLGST